MKTYYVLVESSFAINKGTKRTYEKLGYIKIDLNQHIGDFREFCHNYALKSCRNIFQTPFSYQVSTVTTKPLKKLRILNTNASN